MRRSLRPSVLLLCGGALLASLSAAGGCGKNNAADLESKPREQQMKALEGDPAKIAEMAAKAKGQSGPPANSPAAGASTK